MATGDDRTTSNSAGSARPGPDNRIHPHLPVTAEVGSEGGSYADSTHQVATFEEDLGRTAGQGGASFASTYSLPRAGFAGGGVGTGPDPDHGMIRYPTEPPAPPTASEAWRASGPNWRAGAIGAVAGAAAVIGLQWLRRRL